MFLTTLTFRVNLGFLQEIVAALERGNDLLQRALLRIAAVVSPVRKSTRLLPVDLCRRRHGDDPSRRDRRHDGRLLGHEDGRVRPVGRVVVVRLTDSARHVVESV